MTVTPEEVRRLAALARLALADGEVEEMRAGLEAMLSHVGALPVADEHADFCPAGLEQARLRSDMGPPDMMLLPPSALAPAWEQGFYVVPGLASHAHAEGARATAHEPSGTGDGGAAGSIARTAGPVEWIGVLRPGDSDPREPAE
jgi:aspartyl/glutamyl-tRNA(Asn/Gln) amidotransferase C subunit